MDKQILNFTANEQILTCENPIKISTNKVNYIQANFDLGTNWSGYDSIRAIWWNDFQTISTVLDSLGTCAVPFEVMKRKGCVKVNLVGSISEDDVLTDRLTSYPVVAVIVDCTAQITGANTSPITPSEFELFAQRVHTDAERAEQGASNAETSAQNAHASEQNASQSAQSAHDDKIAIEEAIAEVIQQIEDFEQVQVVVNTLPPSSQATSDFTDGVLTLGIPQGIQGETGPQGPKGDTGEVSQAELDEAVTDLKSDINGLQETVYKQMEYVFSNSASVTSGTSIKEADVNVMCDIPAGTQYTVRIITESTLFTKTSIIARLGNSSEDASLYNRVANTTYTMTATGNVKRIGLYSGSSDVTGSGTLTIVVKYTVPHENSIEEQVETLNSEMETVNTFIGTIPMESNVYDLSGVTEYNGKTQTAVGSQISMEASSTWYYKMVDCEDFVKVTIKELVSANPAPYHTYVFTDANGIVLATDDGTHGSVIEYITYTDINVPSGAKYLYMFTYSASNTTTLSYKVVQNIGNELTNISTNALKKEKAKFDDRFLYVAYSTVHGSSGSINTKEHFIWCAEHGFNSIKGDVRPTSDGGLVMCHDAGFTLNNDGDIVAFDPNDYTPIHDMTYAECTALKHASSGQYVCGIDDFLFVCKKYGTVAYVTVRDEYISELVSALFDALDKYRMREYCIINSFTIATLTAFRAVDDAITLSNVLNTTDVLDTSDIDNAVSLGNCQICAFDYPDFGGVERIPSAVLEYAITKDIRIYEAQINSLTDLDTVINAGISGAHITIGLS